MAACVRDYMCARLCVRMSCHVFACSPVCLYAYVYAAVLFAARLRVRACMCVFTLCVRVGMFPYVIACVCG